jgi:hypothetical protein
LTGPLGLPSPTKGVGDADGDNRGMTITLKDQAGIEGMRLAGRLASEVLTTSRLSSSPASRPTKSTAWRTPT